MVLHNPNNWHWVNKDASQWAKDYFNENLIGISASETDGTTVKIEKVLSVEGDVDVSQRKGKVITLFDVKIQLEYAGQTAEGTDVTGTITIPEAAHDTEEDEYVFDISIYSDAKEKQPVKDLARTKLTPQLRKALYKFAGDLVAEHGKDIQHTKENDPKFKFSAPSAEGSSATSGASTPATGGAAISAAPKQSNSDRVINTTTLEESFEFQTTGQQLYTTFIDPARVAAFTRGAPAVFEPKVGGKFKLFGGNVEGEFKKLDEPNKIVQTWRLAEWPAGHFSTLSLVFDQGYNNTTLRLSWKGVPVGQDEVTKKNFREYYVRSIKVTFGFGAIL